MDSFDVKEALAARSRTTTLDALKSQGRDHVKVIRAEHVAQMLEGAVHRAIEASGFMPRNEVDELVQRSQQEFEHLMRERELELGRARQALQDVERLEIERAELQGRLALTEAERDHLRIHAQAPKSSVCDRQAECTATVRDLTAAQQNHEQLRQALEFAEHDRDQLSEDLQRRQKELLTAHNQIEMHRSERDRLRVQLAEASRFQTDAEDAKRLRRDLLQAQRDRDQATQEALRQDEERKEVRQELERLREERDRYVAKAVEIERVAEQRDALRTRVVQLEQEVESLRRQAQTSASPASAVSSPDFILKLMTEMAELRANMQAQGRTTTAVAAPVSATPNMAAVPDQGLAAAIDKLTGSLSERFERLSKKLGGSVAVEAPQVTLERLFDNEAGAPKLESNLDAVEMKKKQGGGINANLERLKRLKGES